MVNRLNQSSLIICGKHIAIIRSEVGRCCKRHIRWICINCITAFYLRHSFTEICYYKSGFFGLFIKEHKFFFRKINLIMATVRNIESSFTIIPTKPIISMPIQIKKEARAFCVIRCFIEPFTQLYVLFLRVIARMKIFFSFLYKLCSLFLHNLEQIYKMRITVCQ